MKKVFSVLLLFITLFLFFEFSTLVELRTGSYWLIVNILLFLTFFYLLRKSKLYKQLKIVAVTALIVVVFGVYNNLKIQTEFFEFSNFHNIYGQFVMLDDKTYISTTDLDGNSDGYVDYNLRIFFEENYLRKTFSSKDYIIKRVDNKYLLKWTDSYSWYELNSRKIVSKHIAYLYDYDCVGLNCDFEIKPMFMYFGRLMDVFLEEGVIFFIMFNLITLVVLVFPKSFLNEQIHRSN